MQFCIKTNLVHEDFPHRACPTVLLEMQSMTCDVFFLQMCMISVCELLCIYMRHIFLHIRSFFLDPVQRIPGRFDSDGRSCVVRHAPHLFVLTTMQVQEVEDVRRRRRRSERCQMCLYIS